MSITHPELPPEALRSLDWSLLGSSSRWQNKPFTTHATVAELAYIDTLGYSKHYWLPHQSGAVLLSWKPLPWDSDFFGLPMGQIQLLSTMKQTELCSTCRLLLSSLLHNNDIRHWHLEINATHWSLLNELLHLGFRLMDTKLTFINSHPLSHSRKSPMMSHTRPYRATDYPAILQIVQQSTIESRFQRDPLLRPQSSALYAAWIQRLLAPQTTPLGISTANPAVIYEKNHQIIAIGLLEAFILPESLNQLRYYANGLVLAIPGSQGVYYPLIHQLHQQISDTPYLFCEIRISQTHLQAYRVLERFSRLKAVHHSLHWYAGPVSD